MDIERLNRVLRRVRNEDVLTTDCEANGRVQLQRFIRMEEQACREYEQLRRRCSGRTQVVLTKIWTEEQRHLRDLQAEFMVRYGNTLSTQTEAKPQNQRGLLSWVGKIREEEFGAAEEYHRASRATGDHRLQLLYQKHAQEEENHARLLTDLLRRGMG